MGKMNYVKFLNYFTDGIWQCVSHSINSYFLSSCVKQNNRTVSTHMMGFASMGSTNLILKIFLKVIPIPSTYSFF